MQRRLCKAPTEILFIHELEADLVKHARHCKNATHWCLDHKVFFCQDRAQSWRIQSKDIMLILGVSLILTSKLEDPEQRNNPEHILGVPLILNSKLEDPEQRNTPQHILEVPLRLNNMG